MGTSKTGKAIVTAIIIIVAACAFSVTASAAVTNCSGLGTFWNDTVQYSRCNTDQNAGTGSSTFSNSGQTVDLQAKTQRGSQQTVASWSSTSSIPANTNVCANTSVSLLSLKGGGYAQVQLLLTYFNSLGAFTGSFGTITPGNVGTQPKVCVDLPTGATNIWFQVLPEVGGGKPASQERMVMTLMNIQLDSAINGV
jgi:hypothetical protein